MQQSELSGILLMNKPQGFTSHDVVAKLRGILHTKRIGHGGTLDPLATGVLPVFVGGATKAADYAAAQDKEYVAGFALGYNSDTQDSTGAVCEKSDKTVTQNDVEQVLEMFRGAQQQVPPMYSAVKIGGQKLYDLARKGIEIDRPARDIIVHELELLSFDEQAQTGTLRCVVSKGTYVRTLVNDIGEQLQTFAVMSALCRTRSGAFELEACADFETVEQAMQDGTADKLLLPTQSLFADYPSVTLTQEGFDRSKNGAVIFERQTSGFPQQAGSLCCVYFEEKFLMLGRVDTLEKGGLALFVHKNFK